MELDAAERILSAPFAAEKVVIRAENPGSQIHIEIPASEPLRHGDLRLGRPAVRSNIDQRVRIVLAQRRRYGDTRANVRILPVSRELFRAHRRRAVEIHGKTGRRIAKARTMNARELA